MVVFCHTEFVKQTSVSLLIKENKIDGTSKINKIFRAHKSMLLYNFTNVVKYLDVFQNSQTIYIVMEYVENLDLLKYILKMKEISYIPCEGISAGDLKHGPIALIDKSTLVVAIASQPDLYDKIGSNMVEVKTRGAYLMGLTSFGHYEIEDTAQFVTYIPKLDDHFIGSLSVIPLQLLGYYVSVAKGLDVDKPRNLAKSVTVE